MSIVELQRLKTLEAKVAILEALVEKLEVHAFGVEATEDLEDFTSDVTPAKRKRGRPRKDEAENLNI